MHIADVINTIEAEELFDVVLVGHSYAGMVITGVADRLAGRIKKLIYLDAFVPKSGQSMMDLLSIERRHSFEQASLKTQTVPPLTPAILGVSDVTDRDWLNRQLRSQPIRTFSQALVFAHQPAIKRVYIHCTNPPSGSFGQFAQRFSRESGWRYYELHTGHDCMITSPQALTSIIMREID
jgi:pimeloyl-ACP methyl ester carboxylesterase